MMYVEHMQSARKEVRVSKWIRQTHRWVSIIFTASVIANFVAMIPGAPPTWVVYSPLPSLFLMLVTGLCMFVQPYLRARRAGKVARQAWPTATLQGRRARRWRAALASRSSSQAATRSS